MSGIDDERRRREIEQYLIRGRFIRAIEENFGGSPEVARALLGVADNRVEKEADPDTEVFLLNIIHPDSVMSLYFAPSWDRGLVIATSAIGSVRKKPRADISLIKQITCKGRDGEVFTIGTDSGRSFVLDVKKGTVCG
jgi:hypothetical protein